MNTLYYLRKGSQGYYRPNSQGYTHDLREAGLFSYAQAHGEWVSTHGEVTMIPEYPETKPEEGSYILVSNLESALEDAMIAARRDNHEIGHKGESAYIAGLTSNLAYLRKHGILTIR